MYDVNGNGYIDLQEMTQIVRLICHMIHNPQIMILTYHPQIVNHDLRSTNHDPQSKNHNDDSDCQVHLPSDWERAGM